jgi:hypothetical protein
MRNNNNDENNIINNMSNNINNTNIISKDAILNNNTLPIQFYIQTLKHLENRYEYIHNEISIFNKQLTYITSNINTNNNMNNSDKLLNQIQIQYTMFIQLASTISNIHNDVDNMKKQFLILFYANNNINNNNDDNTSVSNINNVINNNDNIDNANNTLYNTNNNNTILNPFQIADKEELIKKQKIVLKLKNDKNIEKIQQQQLLYNQTINNNNNNNNQLTNNSININNNQQQRSGI